MLLAAYAPDAGVLLAGRLLGGISAGMAYPTTLALTCVPSHVNETTETVDHLGGVLSVVFVAALVVTINFAPVPGTAALALGTALVTLAAGGGFFARQRRARSPLYDLHVAGRRIFWVVGLAFAFQGAGVGLTGTPASHSLTSSVPTRRAGMASGTADLQRDLGGAIMQSILGALLTAGYASVIAKSVASSPDRSTITGSVQGQLEKSFAGAQQVAQRYPQYASKITAAAKSAFLAGDQWAYAAAIIGVLLGAALVFFMFPRHEAEIALLGRYQAEDSQPAAVPARAPRPRAAHRKH